MTLPRFLHEPAPTRGRGRQVEHGILRIVADNPSKMTYHGTNSYLVQTPEGTLVIDPGPAGDEAHLDAIIDGLGPSPRAILLTHRHADHFGAVPALRERTGLPVYVSRATAVDGFTPDAVLDDGQEIAGLTVLHTPGHSSDHLCFARADGVVFTGDHVMSWNSSSVSLPDGCMRSYCDQLSRLLGRRDRVYLPGHGPALPDPRAYVARLLANRRRRETEILAHLSDGPDTVHGIAATLYRKSDPIIARAAERNVAAHLEKLRAEARACSQDDVWSIP